MLLCSSSGTSKIFVVVARLLDDGVDRHAPYQAAIDLPGEVALETAHDLGLGLALGSAPGDVDLGGFVPVHAGDDSAVQRGAARRSLGGSHRG